jgi:hypothetical protein
MGAAQRPQKARPMPGDDAKVARSPVQRSDDRGTPNQLA